MLGLLFLTGSGVFVVFLPHYARSGRQQLARWLESVLRASLCLAERLTMPADPEARLARIVTSESGPGDPEPGVRLRSLRKLSRLYPASPRAAEVVRAALLDPDEAVRLAAAIEVGGSENEALALLALESEDAQLRLLGAEALAKLGTAAAVPALHVAEARGPRELSRAARQAIAEIQARLTGADYGQLTLSGSEAGALSLSEEREVGRVSLVGETEQ